MAEVAERINLKDSESAIKWLKANDVTIHKLLRKFIVYQLDLEFAIIKPLVHDLQKRHPKNWKDALENICIDDALFNFILFRLGEPRIGKGLAKVSPTTKEEEELLKSLSS
ncbi:MAG: hypothetical protein EOO51_14585 [Flavobacterium sp.]|nr:MAG: hypothetical protein EOO51_14585 [Flavobacterium sp.]